MDKKKRRPHEIKSLTNHKDYLEFIDREKLVSHKFSNILNQLLKWVGAPSILKKGSWSLPTRYVNIPQQPNNHDCAVFVMKWMELIDPTKLAGCCTYYIEQWIEEKKIVMKIIMSKDNSMRAYAIAAVQNMRVTRPAAALRSPFIPFSTPDCPPNDISL
ncbi:hypothetical protein PIB30_006365 [Stylosanthes scabra]|uniref:Ubiquitin-like protease family profile domain-containing protein n=1 Tax=Stylosanthes scabra TaxID=79078 RepID=A0ABU6S417_9FABA|nr:hypothetical protein [Stylosanthes scabra]